MKLKMSDVVGFAVVRNSDTWQNFAKTPVKTSLAFKIALISKLLTPHLQAFDEARQSQDCDIQQLLNSEIDVPGLEPIPVSELPDEMPLLVAETLAPFTQS